MKFSQVSTISRAGSGEDSWQDLRVPLQQTLPTMWSEISSGSTASSALVPVLASICLRLFCCVRCSWLCLVPLADDGPDSVWGWPLGQQTRYAAAVCWRQVAKARALVAARSVVEVTGPSGRAEPRRPLLF